MIYFIRDWREWGLGTAWWNLRFSIAWSILPGNQKHVSVTDEYGVTVTEDEAA